MREWTMGLGFALQLMAAAYAWLALLASLARRRGSAAPAAPEAVTVLKPLCGAEPGLYEALRSFCVQDYPHYQLVFGMHSKTDAALPSVRRLQEEFGALQISVVTDTASHGTNAKVSNLINMLPYAHHDVLLLADSDISVPPDYLRRVLAPLSDPQVGLVTCGYAGQPRPGASSALGALFINDWFMPQVRLAAAAGSQAFVSGATIALRREVLSRSGGFAALANQLADDFKLGEQVRNLGLRVHLSDLTVRTAVDEPSFSAWWRHSLRWLRTIYSIQPLGYAFCFVTLSLPLALVGAALTRFSANSLLLLGVTVLGRLMLHFRASSPASRWQGLQLALLAPHDVLLLLLWCWSFCNRKVTWREQRFDVDPDGSLHRVA